MFEDYKERFPQKKCGPSSYRKQVCKVLNISFAKLGKEECSTCLVLKGAALRLQNSEASARRGMYDTDRVEARRQDIADKNTLVYTLDLQKVIMLPRMDQYKEVAFTQRIVAFNLTFCPNGGATADRPVVAALWHEAIASRSAAEIAGAIVSLFSSASLPECDNLRVWCDNCGGQNKNYVLFSTLYGLIRTSRLPFKNLEVSYFVSGHSQMAADNFHASVEKSMRQKKNVLNFQDFERCIKSAQKHVVTQCLRHTDFPAFTSGATKKTPTNRFDMAEIAAIRFYRDSEHVMVKRKTLHSNWEQYDFLKPAVVGDPSVTVDVGLVRNFNRGITRVKKAKIVNELGPLIREQTDGARKICFWEDLPSGESLRDIQIEPEVGEFDGQDEPEAAAANPGDI